MRLILGGYWVAGVVDEDLDAGRGVMDVSCSRPEG